MSGTVQIVTEGASGTREVLKSSNQALSVDTGGRPGIAQTPLVSDVPQATKDMLGVGEFIGFRATVGAGDDTVASERLANVYPSTVQAGIDTSITFTSSTAVTRVDVVGLSSTISAADSGGCIDPTAGTAAHALAKMTTYTFSTAVNKVVITITGTWASALEAQITVEGYSYA